MFCKPSSSRTCTVQLALYVIPIKSVKPQVNVLFWHLSGLKGLRGGDLADFWPKLS